MIAIVMIVANTKKASRERHLLVPAMYSRTANPEAIANVPANPQIVSGIAGPHGCSCGIAPKKRGSSIAIVEAQSANTPVGCGLAFNVVKRCDFVTVSKNGNRNGAARSAETMIEPNDEAMNRKPGRSTSAIHAMAS